MSPSSSVLHFGGCYIFMWDSGWMSCNLELFDVDSCAEARAMPEAILQSRIANTTVCSILAVQKWIVMAGRFHSATVLFKCLTEKNRHWRGICINPSSLLILSAPLFVPAFRAIISRSFPCRTWFFGMLYLPCHYSIASKDFCFVPAWYLSYIYSTSISLSSLPPAPAFLIFILYVWESFLNFGFQCARDVVFWVWTFNSMVYFQWKKPLDACKHTTIQW